MKTHPLRTSWTLSTLFGVVVAATAPASAGDDGQGPTTANTLPAQFLLLSGESRRIDVVCLGDSNQLFSGFGWQDGWAVALGEVYPMYATPLLGAGDNNDIGIALNTMAGASMPPSGAPLELTPFSDPAQGIDATPYGYLTTGAMVTPGTDLGMRLSVGNSKWFKNNFNANSALRFHFNYGTFDTAPGAVFQPQVSQPAGFSVLHSPIIPGVGAFGLGASFIDVPAAVRNSNIIRFHWFGEDAPSGVGPVHALYMRAENLDQSTGQSVSTLYGVGGATARDCAIALMQTPETQLITFFEQIRMLQPDPKKVLIRIAFGANDFTENLPSVGPDGPFPAATNESVADNMREIIQQINDVWTFAGWDHSELVFLLVGPHARLSAEPAGYGYRQAISEITQDASNISFINHYRLATVAQMLADRWYEFPSGAHLKELGYESICRLEIGTITQALPSDLNGDCIVDTADLGLLIGAFGSSDPIADLNGDNVVDTADLGILIVHFGAVCP